MQASRSVKVKGVRHNHKKENGLGAEGYDSIPAEGEQRRKKGSRIVAPFIRQYLAIVGS